MSNISLSDLTYNEEWQYQNEKSGASYTNGILPGKIFYSDLSGNITLDDMEVISKIISDIFSSQFVNNNNYIRIADYRRIPRGAIKARQKYIRTIKSVTSLYNCRPQVTYIIGANSIIKATILFTQKLVNQNFVFVDSVEEAFEIINSADEAGRLLGDMESDNDQVIVKNSDIQKLINIVGSSVTDLSSKDFDPISKESPLYLLYSAMMVVADDSKELIEIDQEKEQLINEAKAIEKSFLEVSPDNIFLVDSNCKINSLNREIDGKGCSNIKGQVFQNFVTANYKEVFLKTFNKAAVSNKVETVECRLKLCAGERYFLIRIKKIDEDSFFIISTDLTERKKTEDLLLAERKRLSNIISGTNVGTWEWNVQNGECLVNEKWATILGYDLIELYPVTRIMWEDFIHPEDLVLSNKLLKMHFENELEFFKCEIRMKHKDNKWVWVMVSGQVTTWCEDGKPLIMSGTHLDITERKVAEEANRKIKDQFMKLIYNSPDPMLLIDEQNFVECNQAAAKMIGCGDPEKIKNLHPSELSPEFQPDGIKSSVKAEEMMRIALSTGAHRFEWNHLKFDTGEEIPVEVSLTVTPVAINKRIVLQCIWRDLTKIKEIEKELIRSEKKHRILFETSQDAILLYNPKKGFVDCNPAALNMFGLKEKNEIKSIKPNELVPEFQDDLVSSREKLIEEMKKTYYSGSNYFEIKLKSMTNEVFTTAVVAVTIELDNKKLIYANIRDISKNKEDEKKLKEFANELKVKNAELDKALLKAEAATKAKSEFLANMSHEIRTPLNGVIGFTDLLLYTKLDNVQKQYVTNANTSAHSLLDLINDILDFSKIEAGKLEIENVKTDIIELVEQTADIIKYSASQKGLELLLNIQPDTPRFIYSDPIRLKQILVNLVSNAVKFTEKGEVEIKVRFSRIENKDRGEFFFEVRDTGIGISEEQKKKLFRAFSQADTSITRKFGGTGLGLVISNLIAKKMDSKIELKSNEGRGSSFHFTLQTGFEYSDKKQKINIEDVSRVLIVDDNKNNQIILRDILNYWGIDSETASNGLEAIELLENSKAFDIVIVDFNMPYINGVETIKLMESKVNDLEIHRPGILLYSSSDDINKINGSIDKDNYRKLIKPVKIDELFKSICQISNPQIKFDEKEEKVQEEVESGSYKILVAEDVSINLELIKILIMQLMPSVEILEARNGQEAVDLHKKKSPDLIFMDIQMPVLDGYSASKIIRENEEKENKYTPIVALTAGTVKGEREKCYQAGMDEYLTKPINKAKLKQTLKKLTTAIELIDKDTNYNDVIGDKHFDIEKLASRSDGSHEIIVTLSEVALQQFPEIIENLKKSSEDNDHKKVAKLAHSIKGISLTMSFSFMYKIIVEFENQIKDSEKIDLDSIKEIENEWINIKKEIEENLRIVSN